MSAIAEPQTQNSNQTDTTLNKGPYDFTDLQPGQLRVIKRSGKLTAYHEDLIAAAMKRAFLAVEGDSAQITNRIQEVSNNLAKDISKNFHRRWPSGGNIHIESIQDQVELALMRAGEQKVARSYVLYREQRKTARAQTPDQVDTTINVTLDDGSRTPLNIDWLNRIVSGACKGLDNVAPEQILEATRQNLFDGVKMKDVYKALVMTARTLVETDPDYSFVTARLLLHDLYGESLTHLNIKHDLIKNDIKNYYQENFKAYIAYGSEIELLNKELNNFDLELLAKAIKPERDKDFNYLGLQTLYDRYFQHENDVRIELPQCFFMRVAMGLAISETENRDKWAIEFYNLLSTRDFMSSTPTLFNSGTCHSQLSSCFLTTIPDDLKGIYDGIRDNAMLAKFAGGIGNDWTPVRGMGARIKGTNGKSLGVVPFMNVADATAIAVNQGGKRKGAVVGYLETWHMDIEEFLELRKNTGDDRRRTHDMNTANWIPDLFIKRVFENKDWTLFTPDQTPHLHDLVGEAFETAYVECEAQAAKGELLSKTIPANDLWRKMLGMLFETGHPWFTFKDPCNIRSPQQHVGVVHSSNLCTEITLNTSKEEVAVCNLGSVNLPQHMTADGKLDDAKIQKTVKTAIRMLDNVININLYTIPQAKNSNMKHRPIGLGILGFQDALYQADISYCSDAAVDFADRSMEMISYYAISASCDLAKERGKYESFDGSLWSQGILPIDSIALLQKSRGDYLDQDTSSTMDWDSLRKSIQQHGMRNSNVLAIAPTATISNICGVSQSIEPTYQNLYVKSNMSGEFTVVNPYMVKDLKKLNLWDNVMVHDLKYYDGSLKNIERVPESIKQKYATAFEIEPKWLIECGSRRQKWIDQSQSLNLYMAEPSGKKLDVLYKMAWLKGLKTTYYLRSLGATDTEKATITDKSLNAVAQNVNPNAAPKACSLDDPDCEACQ